MHTLHPKHPKQQHRQPSSVAKSKDAQSSPGASAVASGGSHIGILLVLGLGLVGSLVVLLYSQPQRPAGRQLINLRDPWVGSSSPPLQAQNAAYDGGRSPQIVAADCQQREGAGGRAPGLDGPDGVVLRIPRILHQNYLSGLDALERDSRADRTHFRYPWFLSTWRNYSSLVMQSDALRPFILHSYGNDLVLMAEEPDLANNAQMGSVPGHPLWRLVMRHLRRNAAAGLSDPLYATGPRVITAAFRELFGVVSGPIPGRYSLLLPDSKADDITEGGSPLSGNTSRQPDPAGARTRDVIVSAPASANTNTSATATTTTTTTTTKLEEHPPLRGERGAADGGDQAGGGSVSGSGDNSNRGGSSSSSPRRWSSSAATVYGPRQWFHPCAWNDEVCHMEVSRVTPLLRREPREAAAAVAAAANEVAGIIAVASAAMGSDESRPQAGAATGGPAAAAAAAATAAQGAVVTELMLESLDNPQPHCGFRSGDGGGGAAAGEGSEAGGVAAAAAAGPLVRLNGSWSLLSQLDVVGVHHFSGSWLGYDGGKAERSRGWVVEGLSSFFSGRTLFVEEPCCDLPDQTALTTTAPATRAAGAVGTAGSTTGGGRGDATLHQGNPGGSRSRCRPGVGGVDVACFAAAWLTAPRDFGEGSGGRSQPPLPKLPTSPPPQPQLPQQHPRSDSSSSSGSSGPQSNGRHCTVLYVTTDAGALQLWQQQQQHLHVERMLQKMTQQQELRPAAAAAGKDDDGAVQPQQRLGITLADHFGCDVHVLNLGAGEHLHDVYDTYDKYGTTEGTEAWQAWWSVGPGRIFVYDAWRLQQQKQRTEGEVSRPRTPLTGASLEALVASAETATTTQEKGQERREGGRGGNTQVTGGYVEPTLDLLVLNCGNCSWELAQDLYDANSTVMSRMGAVLMVGLPPVAWDRSEILYKLYEVMYQIHGFVGFWHDDRMHLAAVPAVLLQRESSWMGVAADGFTGAGDMRAAATGADGEGCAWALPGGLSLGLRRRRTAMTSKDCNGG
ncbi:hypothetical protein PLESTB_000713200 [Pleodorina starrii]|uniref:Uncharacterized protein n=1 Tax=Pleodorina starrii TaxID=330485 RepID=A0A9W6BJI3_9CHLO|nr:hypothetical protein PLESTB_000713200 [Pleodorina starrii]